MVAPLSRFASHTRTGPATNKEDAVAMITPAVIGQANPDTAGPPQIAIGKIAASVVPEVKMQRART
jgi:hypothetical protein